MELKGDDMNLLLSLIQSDWFVVVLIVLVVVAFIWCIIALASRDERDYLLETIGKLITKPVIFLKDQNPHSVKFYPRELLETVSTALTYGSFKAIKTISETGKIWRKKLEDRYSKDDSSLWKMIGSVMLLIATIAFLYADLIAIFNTLNQMGWITEVPTMFRNYEYAVTFGSFFTIVLSGFVLFEIFGWPIFTNWADQRRIAKLLLILTSILLVVLSVAVSIGLGLDRYRQLSNLDPVTSANISAFNTLVLTVLVPLNSILGTFLIFSEGLKGLPIFGNLISQIVLYIAIAFLFAFAILNYPLWFGIDILYRFMLIFSNILFFFMLTPLDKIFNMKIFNEPEKTDTNGKPITDVRKSNKRITKDISETLSDE